MINDYNPNQRAGCIEEYDEHGREATTTLKTFRVYENGVGGWKSFLTEQGALNYCAKNNIRIEL